MKAEDFISEKIQTYPMLYKDIDYEKSKLRVLKHAFFTCGNGLDLAKTTDQTKGGYLVEPNYKMNEKTDEYYRTKDKYYGKIKYRPLPEGYFESTIYYMYGDMLPTEVFFKEGVERADKLYLRYDKLSDGFPERLAWMITKNTNPITSFNISSYSIAYQIYKKKAFLQKDWVEALIFLCNKALEYYEDENQYKFDDMYPKKGNIQVVSNHKKIEADITKWVLYRKKQVKLLTDILITINNK